MPFWKKAFQKTSGVYYPQAVVQGKPVETETIAKDLAKISTVSNSDVQAGYTLQASDIFVTRLTPWA